MAATLAMTGTGRLLTYSASLENPAKKNISNLQIAPTLNIMLPEHLFEVDIAGVNPAD